MENLFVSYEIALELKDKGFNKPCFGVWNSRECSLYIDLRYDTDQKNMPDGCKAPLYQQVTDWLRENHNIEIQISNVDNKIDKWEYQLNNLILSDESNLNYDSSYDDLYYSTYYEALEEAIIEVLNKHIK